MTRRRAILGRLAGGALAAALLAPVAAAMWRERASTRPWPRLTITGLRARLAKVPEDARRWRDVVAKLWMRPPVVASEEELSIPLTVTEAAGVDRRGDPVTTGVPLPERAAIRSATQLELLDQQGRPVEAQLAVMTRWGGAADSHQSARWVLLDFQADVPAHGHSRYYLARRAAARAPSGGGPRVTVTESPDSVLVDTGAGRFRVRKDVFTFLEDAQPGAAPPATAGQPGMFLVDQDGIEYNSARDGGEYQLAVERSGPLRAQLKASGRLVGPSGDRRFRYEVRIEAFAGKRIVKVRPVIIFSEDMFRYRPADIGLRLRARPGAQARFEAGAARASLTAGGAAWIVQEDFDRYVVEGGGRLLETGEKSAGWAAVRGAAGGIGVYVHQMWQNYPFEIEGDAGSLTVHFWPQHADFTAQVERKKAQVVAGQGVHFWPFHPGRLLDLRAVSVRGRDRLEVDTRNNAIGAGKSYELWYVFERPGEQETGSLAPALGSRMLAVNPEWLSGSGEFGALHPYDPRRFPALEQALDRVFDRVPRLHSRHSSYGMLHWGDVNYGATRAGAAERFWMHFRVNWQHGLWLAYIRTGNPSYLPLAVAASRHGMDVDLCQVDAHLTDVLGNRVRKFAGAPMRTHETGTAHWHSLTAGEPYLDNSIDPLVTYYLLTGDDRARELAGLRGRRVLNAGLEVFDAFPGARQAAGGLSVPLAMYKLTADARYLDYLRRVADIIVDKLATPSGYLGSHAAFNWNIFNSTWPPDHIDEAAQLLERRDLRAVFLRLARALGGMGVSGGASGLRAYGYPLRSYAEAWALTGDLEYLRYGKRLLELWAARETPGDMHQTARLLLRMPYLMHALARWNHDPGEPALPPFYAGVPTGDHRLLFLVREDRDRNFRLRFSFESGTAFFYPWPASGTFHVRIRDPRNRLVAEESFRTERETGKLYQGGKDGRLRVYEIAADGVTGQYRVEIHADQPRQVVGFAGSDLAKVVVGSSNGELWLDRGRYYTPAPEGVSTARPAPLHPADGSRLWAFELDNEYGELTRVRLSGPAAVVAPSAQAWFEPVQPIQR